MGFNSGFKGLKHTDTLETVTYSLERISGTGQKMSQFLRERRCSQ